MTEDLFDKLFQLFVTEVDYWKEVFFDPSAKVVVERDDDLPVLAQAIPPNIIRINPKELQRVSHLSRVRIAAVALHELAHLAGYDENFAMRVSTWMYGLTPSVGDHDVDYRLYELLEKRGWAEARKYHARFRGCRMVRAPKKQSRQRQRKNLDEVYFVFSPFDN